MTVLQGVLADRDAWSAVGGHCPHREGDGLIGTKSAMLIMREAFYGTTRFDDFARRVGITKAAASARLSELVDAGLLTKQLPGTGGSAAGTNTCSPRRAPTDARGVGDVRVGSKTPQGQRPAAHPPGLRVRRGSGGPVHAGPPGAAGRTRYAAGQKGGHKPHIANAHAIHRDVICSSRNSRSREPGGPSRVPIDQPRRERAPPHRYDAAA